MTALHRRKLCLSKISQPLAFHYTHAQLLVIHQCDGAFALASSVVIQSSFLTGRRISFSPCLTRERFDKRTGGIRLIAASMYGRFGHGLFAKSGGCSARSVAQKAIRPLRTVRAHPSGPGAGPGAGPGSIPGRESAGNTVRPAYANRQAFVRGLGTVLAGCSGIYCRQQSRHVSSRRWILPGDSRTKLSTHFQVLACRFIGLTFPGLSSPNHMPHSTRPSWRCWLCRRRCRDGRAGRAGDAAS